MSDEPSEIDSLPAAIRNNPFVTVTAPDGRVIKQGQQRVSKRIFATPADAPASDTPKTVTVRAPQPAPLPSALSGLLYVRNVTGLTQEEIDSLPPMIIQAPRGTIHPDTQSLLERGRDEQRRRMRQELGRWRERFTSLGPADLLEALAAVTASIEATQTQKEEE